MAVTRVSHSCLLIELDPLCNSMAASLWFKSCEDHSLLKLYNGGKRKTITGLDPKFRVKLRLVVRLSCAFKTGSTINTNFTTLFPIQFLNASLLPLIVLGKMQSVEGHSFGPPYPLLKIGCFTSILGFLLAKWDNDIPVFTITSRDNIPLICQTWWQE